MNTSSTLAHLKILQPSGYSVASFPLTPRGEGATVPGLLLATVLDSRTPLRLFPLPWGEGQGEGGDATHAQGCGKMRCTSAIGATLETLDTRLALRLTLPTLILTRCEF